MSILFDVIILPNLALTCPNLPNLAQASHSHLHHYSILFFDDNRNDVSERYYL
jgi:hypothetical protein